MQSMMSCPSCGHVVPIGTPSCGNCGANLQGGPGPGGPPGVPPPMGANGFNPAKLIRILVMLALAGAISFSYDDVIDWVRDIGGQVDDTADGFRDNFDDFGGRIDGGGNTDEDVTVGYRSVDQVIRAINAGGVPCGQKHVDHADEYVATGSCQSRGTHVQINLYLKESTLEFGREFYVDSPFTVVHKDNWWVSSTLPVVREIKGALGGRVTQGSV